MVKCDICSRKVARTFLGKLVGTIVYDSKHKKRYVCKDCQRDHKDEDLIDVIEQ